MYFVITCDVINSKKIEKFDDKLKEKIKILNDEIENIVVKFSSSRGDEIQGVLSYDKNIFRNIKILRRTLYPLKLRIGIGVGDMEKENIDYNNSWNMNGEIFYLARNSLLNISKEKTIKTKILSEEAMRFDAILESEKYLIRELFKGE